MLKESAIVYYAYAGYAYHYAYAAVFFIAAYCL